jgi:isoleucyl-tRNA synthetase
MSNEANILKFWESNGVTDKVMNDKMKKGNFTLYEGPPFLSGKPHFGHIVVSSVKDTILRHQTMKGNKVNRTTGNDCHGVPVERKVLGDLKLSTTKDILNYGVDKFNDACKNNISNCNGIWQEMYNRIGRWADFNKLYQTCDLKFMESVWWSFKQLYDKGLISQKTKIVPYSTACATSLSNFEAALNYKNVNDTAVTVAFKLKNYKNTYALAWTTTPWTLPCNKALCTNKNITMVEINDSKTDNNYILAKSLVNNYFSEYKINREFKASDLENEEYESLFVEREKCCIIVDDYVTETSGTGFVHISPEHGEDDLRVSIKYKIVSEDGDGLDDFIDDDGIFMNPPFLRNMTIKQATKTVVEKLKEKGILIRSEQYNHNYPMCWRTDTPLIYRAMKNMFMNVTSIKEKLIEKTKKINFVPNKMKTLFDGWIENARDWCISRSRFWGTPIPVWQSEDGDQICIGSIEELKRYIGDEKYEINDLHIDKIDKIVIIKDGKKYKRVRYVIDCWYESGSMSFAQFHYPFENKEEFHASYPADLVVEGSEQYKLWFYVMSVLGVALYDEIPFRNVVCTGLVMAENGQKMSKSLGNFIDPKIMIEKYGSDALRLYFLSTPITCAENMCFSETNLRVVSSETLILLSNVFNFYKEYATKMKKEDNIDCNNIEYKNIEPVSLLDKWIVQHTNKYVNYIVDKMDDADLYGIVNKFRKYMEQLSTWYIKLNRDNLKGKNGLNNQLMSLRTLRKVLKTISLHMAPIIPFMSETIHQSLRDENEELSIHQCEYNEMKQDYDEKLEEKMELLEDIILTIRKLRSDVKFNLKMPVKKVLLVSINIDELKESELFEIIYTECNILNIETDSKMEYHVDKNKVADVAKLREKLKQEGKMNKMKEMLLNPPDDCSKIEYVPKNNQEYSQKMMANESLVVYFDPTQDNNTLDMYIIRTFCAKVQNIRKTKHMHPWQAVTIKYTVDDTKIEEKLNNLLKEYKDEIMRTLSYYPENNKNIDYKSGFYLEVDEYKIMIDVELK